VSKKKLIDTLQDLKENRRLSSESEKILKPFIGVVNKFTFSFIEGSRTFSSQVDDHFANGQTVWAHFVDYGLECSILYPPSENEWVDGFSKGDEFENEVEVLQLDNLYQRVIFGHSVEKQADEILEVSQPSETEKLDHKQIEEPQDENHEFKKSLNDASPYVDSVEIAKQLKDKPELEELDQKVGYNEKFLVEEKKDSFLEAEIEIEPEKIVEAKPIKNKEIEAEPIGKDVSKSIDTNIELERRRDRKQPPSIPSLKVQKKAQEIDFIELERIRDKRYEEGAQSLTDEEQEILSIAGSKTKKMFSSETSNSSTSKKSREENNPPAIAGCRVVFGIITGYCGLQSLANGSVIGTIIFLSLAWFLFKPFFKNVTGD
jgi:hypothetical protein